jgi:hypothetical protein
MTKKIPIADSDNLLAHLPAMVLRLKEELQHRGIQVVYFPNGKGALRYLTDQIPPGAQVMSGGSSTLKSIGFEAVLQSGRYDYYRPKITALSDNRERIKLRRRAIVADYFVGGINAISLTGEILNVDGSGSRVAGYAYGGGKIYMVAGVNKIEPTLEAAFNRLRNQAAMQECRHLGKKTPCAQDGVCRNYECRAPERQCGKVLIIENEKIPDRITVVLIGESLGF